MAKPDPGKLVRGPRGENVFVRDGRAFLRERDGSVATISEADIPRALEMGETPATQADVQARDRSRSNADYRAEQGTLGSMRAAAESAGRTAIDTALTVPRAMGAETASAGAVLSAITGIDESEQLRRAEAFSEPLLGGTNVGSVLFDVASMAAGVGVGSKALRGVGLSQRLLGQGAIDAATGALAGGAQAAEGAWQQGQELDRDALLMAMGTGSLLNAGLGSLGTLGAEALSGARRAAAGTLGPMGPGSVKMLRGAAKAVDMVEQPTLRIRGPTGSGTPGAGFGMLRKNKRLGSAMRWVAGKLDERVKAGQVATREADAVASMAAREAAAAERRVTRELSKAETSLSRAQSLEARTARAALMAEQKSAASLERIRRTAVAKDEREAFSAKRATDQAQARYAEAAQKSNAAAAAERAELAGLESRLAEARARITLTKGKSKISARHRTVRALEDELSAVKEKHFQRRRTIDVELDERGSELAAARGRLKDVERLPKGQAAVREAEQRHIAQVELARSEHIKAKERLFDADRALKRAAQERESLLADQLAGRADALDAATRPDVGQQTSLMGRLGNAALAAGDLGRRGAAQLSVAYNAQDEQRRNIDKAIQAAASPGGAEQWQNISGAGDFANFPDQQFQRPGESRRDAFLNRTDELSRWLADPEALIEVMAQGVAGLSVLGPQTSSAVMERAMRAVAFLGQYAQASRNPRNPWEPKETVGLLDDGSIDAFERLWNATMFPGVIVDEVATWSLSLETIAAAGSVHPDLLSEMALSMTELVMSGAFEPDLHQRMQLSGLTGIPDLSIRPDFQVAYGSYMEAAVAMQAPPAPRGKPGRPSGSPTMAQQFRTLSEQVLTPGR